MNPFWLEDIVRSALVEDIGRGDRTAEATAPKSAPAEGRIIAKSAGRIAGIDAARLAFQLLDPAVEFTGVEDGADVDAGQEVASVRGPARALLTAERTALNFLQRRSGIATAAAAAVEAAKPYGAKIVDTRKTTPGLRQLEKHAVRMGGGFNHRHGLDDAILIKENHIAIAGGLEA